ncbi:MAG: hypothetical protein JWN78_2662 [Bacteroidota bacterium]|nr:hypothetical protein [Bacteroidota bacterium]
MRLLQLLLLIGVISCQSTTKNLGEQFMVKNPVSVDSVLHQLSVSNSIPDIQVEGKIEKSCMSEGCWFTIKDLGGNEILFNVKDKKFRVPINSPGKEVVVLADAASDTTSKQRAELSVRGLRFK